MIASWMLYAFLVSALVTVAAFALDRVADARRWPLRTVWIGALLLSVAWPLGSVVRRFMPVHMTGVRVLPFTITVQSAAFIVRASRTPSFALIVDRSLIALWCVLSAVLLIRLVQGVVILQRTRGGWTRRHVDGTLVRVSANVGPAVVGLRSMDVVLPEWILALDAPLRAIVLRHEEEHRAARDPYALFAAALVVALMPWNVALWIQARRLRLAIELDCDSRVLRAHPSAERYGLLMLTIAQRRTVAPTLFAAMMTEPTSQLERRILAMRQTTRRIGRATVYGGTAVAIAVLTFAASLQAADATFAAPITKHLLPTISAPAPIAALSSRSISDAPVRVELASRRKSASTAATVAPAAYDNPAPKYPNILINAEIEGSVVVEFSTDQNGVPEMSTLRVVSSTHDLFTNAVTTVLPTWHLTPLANAHIPFVFRLAAGPGEPRLPSQVAVDGIDAVVITASRYIEVPTTSPIRSTAPAGAARILDGAPQAGPTRMTDNQTYFEYQVERTASPIPGAVPPRYPDSLRVANVDGEVLVQVVIDTTGHAEMSTLKILKSTHPLFTESVEAALPNLIFHPALVGGRPVKQLLQMPFQFNLTR